MKRGILTLIFIISIQNLLTAQVFNIKGSVIDEKSRRPVSDAYVSVEGKNYLKTITDSLGNFLLKDVPGGIHRMIVTCIGYQTATTPEYVISATSPKIIIALTENQQMLQSITIRPNAFQKSVESPVSMQVIGVREIEKSPGGNRDVSRIVRNYPGVSFSPANYRNDLIVRGGGPGESRFYMDGIEIPNINHFATQGASGGPVGLVNADLVREIKFYTGAFPANRGGAMSSVLDFRLREGNPERQTFKTTLGASEVSLSGRGHFNANTTYLFSVRQSYLQLLFKVLGLPLLPNFTDGQFKIKSTLRNRDELLVMGITGVDRMKLNTELEGDYATYLLSYLPIILQETFTTGLSYRHFCGKHTQTYVASHSYLNNRYEKYINNDKSNPANRILETKAIEQKTTLRAENVSNLKQWTLKEGLEWNNYHYSDQAYQQIFTTTPQTIDYRGSLNLLAWGLYFSGEFRSADQKFSSSMGIRFDGNNYSKDMARLWKQWSPRISARYAFNEQWSIGSSIGLYHQLPPFTALSFKDKTGALVNQDLTYSQVLQTVLGGEWKPTTLLALSVEGFYKNYSKIPVSLVDGIPLACKGADYGIVGNEPLSADARGRAYGVEALIRWQIPERLYLTGSFTWYHSEYQANRSSLFIPSAWDNKFIINASGTYEFPKNWSLGTKLSCIGGAPYTPYDLDRSALVEAWDVAGRPYLDYTRYNELRSSAFAQLDLRVDKVFYLPKWSIGIYVDLQNVLNSKFVQQDAWINTGEIINPEAPKEEQRYQLRNIPIETGSLVPTIGLMAEF